MTEFNKMMEYIQMSDRRIASLTKEIKEMECEVKKHEGEMANLRAKEKQLEQDNKYRSKVLTDKESELKIVCRQFEIWRGLLEEKRATKKSDESSLDEIKVKVWDARIKFCDDVGKFLEGNDYLIYGGQNTQEAIKLKEEENRVEGEICMLEYEVTSLEIEREKLFHQLKLLPKMEMNRQELDKEPETSPTFISLKKKLQGYYIDLGQVEQQIMFMENKERPLNVTAGPVENSFLIMNKTQNAWVPEYANQNFMPPDQNLNPNQVVKVLPQTFLPKSYSNLSKPGALQEKDINTKD